MTNRSRSDVIITASIVVGVVGIVLALAGLILGGFGSSGDADQVIEQALDLPDPRATIARPSTDGPESVPTEPLSRVDTHAPATESAPAATERLRDQTLQAPSVAAPNQQAEKSIVSAGALDSEPSHPGSDEFKASESPRSPARSVPKATSQEQRKSTQIAQDQTASTEAAASQQTPQHAANSETRGHPTSSRKKVAAQGGLRSTAWLRQQDSNHYTIQILAVRRLQALKDYAVAQSIPLDLAYYQTRRDGRDYYVLVAGVFPTRSAAKVAVSKLPKSVRANTPWIRKIEAVQRAIK